MAGGGGGGAMSIRMMTADRNCEKCRKSYRESECLGMGEGPL